MQRILILAVSIAVAAASLSAGTVTTMIGGPNGLSSAYIMSNGGSEGGWVEKNYDSYLFNGVSTGSQPGTAYNATYMGTPPNSTLTDSMNLGVTFNMIDDGCGGTNAVTGGPFNSCTTSTSKTNNVWVAAQNGAPSTITIPIGIFDATDVFTQLNNEYGLSGAQDTTIEFDFGTNATTANGTPLILNLINSSNTTAGTGQLRTGTTSTNGSCYSCAGFANMTTAATSTINGVTILTARAFAQSYNTQLPQPLANTPFYGSNLGNVFLSDQEFELPAFNPADPYLVDIKITENNGVAYTSQTALSAITVQSSTPEPSAIWLALTGLLALGAVSLYRRKVSA